MREETLDQPQAYAAAGLTPPAAPAPSEAPPLSSARRSASVAARGQRSRILERGVRDSPVGEESLRVTAMLQVRLLGPLEAIVAGEPVDVPGAKRQALIAFLALRPGQVVAADTLVEALWGSDLPAAPRNAVQHHVTRLRRALGPDTIRLAQDGYALEGAIVDAFQFEELLAAARAALREGDPRSAAETIATRWLSGAALRCSACRTPRGRGTAGGIAAGCASARRVEERFEAALALGEHAEIGIAVRAALEESPFRERLWGQLMLALYRSGRQADALETFQKARKVLSEQLALEPGPDLRRLQQAILAHDPAIAPVPAAPRRRGNLPAPSPPSSGARRNSPSWSTSCGSTGS